MSNTEIPARVLATETRALVALAGLGTDDAANVVRCAWEANVKTQQIITCAGDPDRPDLNKYITALSVEFVRRAMEQAIELQLRLALDQTISNLLRGMHK